MLVSVQKVVKDELCSKCVQFVFACLPGIVPGHFQRALGLHGGQSLVSQMHRQTEAALKLIGEATTMRFIT